VGIPAAVCFTFFFALPSFCWLATHTYGRDFDGSYRCSGLGMVLLFWKAVNDTGVASFFEFRRGSNVHYRCINEVGILFVCLLVVGVSCSSGNVYPEIIQGYANILLAVNRHSFSLVFTKSALLTHFYIHIFTDATAH
jgi:hypothetical protein